MKSNFDDSVLDGGQVLALHDGETHGAPFELNMDGMSPEEAASFLETYSLLFCLASGGQQVAFFPVPDQEETVKNLVDLDRS